MQINGVKELRERVEGLLEENNVSDKVFTQDVLALLSAVQAVDIASAAPTKAEKKQIERKFHDLEKCCENKGLIALAGKVQTATYFVATIKTLEDATIEKLNAWEKKGYSYRIVAKKILGFLQPSFLTDLFFANRNTITINETGNCQCMDHLPDIFDDPRFESLHSLEVVDTLLKVLPDSLKHCKNLEILDVHRDRTKDVLKDNNGCFVAARKKYGGEGFVIPSWFNSLQKLKSLNVSGNYCAEQLFPHPLKGCKNLEYMRASFCGLIEVPEFLRGCKNLKYVDLSDNLLSSLPNWIFELPATCTIDLGNINSETAHNTLSPHVLHTLRKAELEGRGPRIDKAKLQERRGKDESDILSAEKILATIKELINEDVSHLKSSLEESQALRAWVSRILELVQHRFSYQNHRVSPGKPCFIAVSDSMRKQLIYQVCDYILFSQTNREFLKFFASTIEEALDAYGEIVLLSAVFLYEKGRINFPVTVAFYTAPATTNSLLQLEIQRALMMKQNSQEQLIDILMGVHALSILENFIREKYADQPFIDKVEMYLTYAATLKEELFLPFSIEKTFCFSQYVVPAEDLIEARELILAETGSLEKKCTFFLKQPSWVAFLESRPLTESKANTEGLLKLTREAFSLKSIEEKTTEKLAAWIDRASRRASREEAVKAGLIIEKFLADPLADTLDFWEVFKFRNLPNIFDDPRFKKLRSLDLGMNSINRLPSSVRHCTNLCSLTVCIDDSAIFPYWIAELENLQEINIRYSRLDNTSLQYLRECKNLKSLVIDKSGFDHSILYTLPEEIRYCKNLEKLEISLIHISNSNKGNWNIPYWISELENLQEIVIHFRSGNPKRSNQPIEYLCRDDLRLEPLRKCSNLKSLVAKGCEVYRLPEEMKECNNLEKLDLRDNKFLLLPEWIVDLENLKELNVSYPSNYAHLLPKGCAVNKDFKTPENLYELLSLSKMFKNINEREPFSVLEQAGIKSFLSFVKKDFGEEEVCERYVNEDPIFRKWLTILFYSFGSNFFKNFQLSNDVGSLSEGLKECFQKAASWICLSEESAEFREFFHLAMQQAICDVKEEESLEIDIAPAIGFSLLRLDIECAIATVPIGDFEGLARVLREVHALSVLVEIAKEKSAVDWMEISLTYLNKLSRDLFLPFRAHDAFFISDYQIQNKELQAVKDMVLVTIDNVDKSFQFLVQQSSWRKALKNQYPNEYASLQALKEAENTEGMLGLTWCALMG